MFLYHGIARFSRGAQLIAASLLFPNDPFSMAASIIRLPLIIEVVQITIFLRSVEENRC